LCRTEETHETQENTGENPEFFRNGYQESHYSGEAQKSHHSLDGTGEATRREAKSPIILVLLNSTIKAATGNTRLP
jgi:hypothetical protein